MSQLVPFLTYGLDFVQNDLNLFDGNSDSKMFITLDGLNSGVPTLTTPTLTPTTLRNIEQTFIELQESHQNEACFVPPLVHSIGNNQYISASEADIHSVKNGVWSTANTTTAAASSLSSSTSSGSDRPTPPLTPASSSNGSSSSGGSNAPAAPGSGGVITATASSRRNMGGRKPAKAANITPEEEERRMIRRERNKMAAARCRKRRVDHTNALLRETESLEEKKQSLQAEIEQLRNDQEELKYVLDSHRSCCRLHAAVGSCGSRSTSPSEAKTGFVPYPVLLDGDKGLNSPRIKTELDDSFESLDDDLLFTQPPAKKIMLSSAVPNIKHPRPSSLNVSTPAMMPQRDIPISTPSTGIELNYNSLMEGGTGLTPVSAPLVPCGAQQRHLPTTCVDLSSPDTNGPPKLVSL